MWTQEHRQVHDRKGLRYPSDLTEADWALVAPLIPRAKRGGRPRHVDMAIDFSQYGAVESHLVQL